MEEGFLIIHFPFNTIQSNHISNIVILHNLYKLDHHRHRIGGGERGEGVGLVRLLGAATSEVGDRPQGDEGDPLLVTDQRHGGALHLDRAHAEFVVYESPIGRIVQIDACTRPS